MLGLAATLPDYRPDSDEVDPITIGTSVGGPTRPRSGGTMNPCRHGSVTQNSCLESKSSGVGR